MTESQALTEGDKKSPECSLSSQNPLQEQIYHERTSPVHGESSDGAGTQSSTETKTDSSSTQQCSGKTETIVWESPKSPEPDAGLNKASKQSVSAREFIASQLADKDKPKPAASVAPRVDAAGIRWEEPKTPEADPGLASAIKKSETAHNFIASQLALKEDAVGQNRIIAAKFEPASEIKWQEPKAPEPDPGLAKAIQDSESAHKFVVQQLTLSDDSTSQTQPQAKKQDSWGITWQEPKAPEPDPGLARAMQNGASAHNFVVAQLAITDDSNSQTQPKAKKQDSSGITWQEPKAPEPDPGLARAMQQGETAHKFVVAQLAATEPNPTPPEASKRNDTGIKWDAPKTPEPDPGLARAIQQGETAHKFVVQQLTSTEDSNSSANRVGKKDENTGIKWTEPKAPEPDPGLAKAAQQADTAHKFVIQQLGLSDNSAKETPAQSPARTVEPVKVDSTTPAAPPSINTFDRTSTTFQQEPKLELGKNNSPPQTFRETEAVTEKTKPVSEPNLNSQYFKLPTASFNSSSEKYSPKPDESGKKSQETKTQPAQVNTEKQDAKATVSVTGTAEKREFRTASAQELVEKVAIVNTTQSTAALRNEALTANNTRVSSLQLMRTSIELPNDSSKPTVGGTIAGTFKSAQESIYAYKSPTEIRANASEQDFKSISRSTQIIGKESIAAFSPVTSSFFPIAQISQAPSAILNSETNFSSAKRELNAILIAKPELANLQSLSTISNFASSARTFEGSVAGRIFETTIQNTTNRSGTLPEQKISSKAIFGSSPSASESRSFSTNFALPLTRFSTSGIAIANTHVSPRAPQAIVPFDAKAQSNLSHMISTHTFSDNKISPWSASMHWTGKPNLKQDGPLGLYPIGINGKNETKSEVLEPLKMRFVCERRYLTGLELALGFAIASAGIAKNRRQEQLGELSQEEITQTGLASTHSSQYKRSTYLVKHDDSLTEIAEKLFSDTSIAALIADINAGNIEEHLEGDKRIVVLNSRQLLELPWASEVESFSRSKNADRSKQEIITIVKMTEVDRELLASFNEVLTPTVFGLELSLSSYIGKVDIVAPHTPANSFEPSQTAIETTAHDLKSPLMSAQVSIDLLEEYHVDLSDEAFEAMQTVRDDMDHTIECAYQLLKCTKDLTKLRLDSDAGEQDKHLLQELSAQAEELSIPLQRSLESLERFENLENERLSNKAREQLLRARSGINKVIELIDEQFVVANPTCSARREKTESCSLLRIVDSAVITLSALAEKKRINLINECSAASVAADEQKISQVVMNLLSNAIKFAPENSSVRITSHILKDTVKLSVIDQGPGLQKKEASNLFQKYSQLSNKGSNGHGLGLSLCKSIVHVYGGEIGVSSRPGRGSTFWLEIPKQQLATPAPKTAFQAFARALSL